MDPKDLYLSRFLFESDEGGGGAAPAPADPPADAPPPTEGGQAGDQGEEPPTESPEGEQPEGDQATQPDLNDLGEPEVDPIDVPRYPGAQEQEPGDSAETSRLRNYVGQLTDQLEQYRERLEAAELADMDEADRLIAVNKRRQQELEQRERQFQDQQANSQWYDYFRQWPGVDPNSLDRNAGAVEWQHSVLTQYAQTIHKQKAQIDQLKKVLEGQRTQKPEPTSVQSSSPVQRKSVYQMNFDEMDSLVDRARHGLVTADDYPPLPTTP